MPQKDRDAYNAYQRKWYKANPDKVATIARKRMLKQKFGMTLEQYDELAENGCEICGAMHSTSGRRLDVDHDHKTGEVRGILCNSCNGALGRFGDDLSRLRLAVQYLERFEHVDHCD